MMFLNVFGYSIYTWQAFPALFRTILNSYHIVNQKHKSVYLKWSHIVVIPTCKATALAAHRNDEEKTRCYYEYEPKKIQLFSRLTKSTKLWTGGWKKVFLFYYYVLPLQWMDM